MRVCPFILSLVFLLSLFCLINITPALKVGTGGLEKDFIWLLRPGFASATFFSSSLSQIDIRLTCASQPASQLAQPSCPALPRQTRQDGGGGIFEKFRNEKQRDS